MKSEHSFKFDVIEIDLFETGLDLCLVGHSLKYDHTFGGGGYLLFLITE